MMKNVKIKYLIIIVAILLLAGAAYLVWQNYLQKPISSSEMTKILEAIENESIDSPIAPLVFPQLGFDVPLEIGSTKLNVFERPSVEDAIKVRPPEINVNLSR